MSPKSKKAKEERLLKQRLCQRRRYAEIKNDPKLLAIEKEKRRQKYLKKKAEKVTEKSPRDIKEQRKKWKENSKRYRQRKKDGKQPSFETVQVVSSDQNTTSVLDTDKINPEDPLNIKSATVKKIRYEEFKKRKVLLKIIAHYKKKDKAQTKRIQRLKKLLAYYREKNKTNKMCSVSTTNTCSVNDNNDHIEVNSNRQKPSVIDTIKNFYLQDTNSVLCAGKKEYITKNKIQMQKRYLCLPLKELYQTFVNDTNIKVSYSFFCKMRPFWVAFPKKTNRKTCECQIHENIKLLIEALHRNSVIRERTYDQVLSKLCCDSRNASCLKRNCHKCKFNRIEYYLDSSNSICTFYEWKRVVREVDLTDGRKKKKIVTEKRKNTSNTKDVILKFEKDLDIFCEHTHKIVSPYNAVNNLKQDLNIYEACVHVDFSENYSLKYGTEVQSFHFGASRQQVSLHTSVIYTHSFSTGKITPTSMCTVSDCLRHDAPAVWAHLLPLINETINLNPLIDTIHFLSDSPSSQYRNKYMFYVVSQLYKDFPQLKKITWNYSEAGHGKGAPDGVGATLKRTADRMITFGKDIGTFKQFYDLMINHIANENLKVIVKKVDKEVVIERERLIPKDLKPFKGTFSVYQILWEISTSRNTVRRLSCFDCDTSKICIHGNHLGFIDKVVSPQKENINPISAIRTHDVAKVNDTKSTKRRIVILSDVIINKTTVSEPSSSKKT